MPDTEAWKFRIRDLDPRAFDRDGFVVVDQLIDTARIAPLHGAFEALFNGEFETGVMPDEVNWQQKTGDPELTRQICNGWKANRVIAATVLDESLGRAIGALSGWSGVRLMIDNVIWKPPGAKSLGYHQDSSFLSWFAPSDLLTCWVALDDTSAAGGTVEFARGSHEWSHGKPEGEFHAPEDYRLPMRNAASREGIDPEIAFVEVKAGGGSFHHGWTWHGSGKNLGDTPRRSVVLHAMNAEAKLVPEHFGEGIGPIYSRYRRLGSNELDEHHFPVIWSEDGYRTPALDDYLKPQNGD